MNNILQQLQEDLLNQNATLSNTLRKAKVLASQLHSQDLTVWVANELDGYKSAGELPDYRVIRTLSVGKWTNGAWIASNHGVPLHKISDDNLKELLTTYRVFDGIRTIEQLAHEKERHFIFGPEIANVVNSYVHERGYGYAEIEIVVPPHEFEQILDSVKNRLLDFVLKLDETWPSNATPPSQDRLKDMISVIIYNQPQGGNMSIFDQRGQQVHYQYNASGNININAVQDKAGFIIELEKLRKEIELAKESKAISQDIAVEAEYHVLQAIKTAKVEKAEKQTLVEHIGKAKALLGDLTAAVGLVTALSKAIEVAGHFFK